MSDTRVAAYGGWKSPLTAKRVASGAMTCSQVTLDGCTVYWLEQRPMEGGRSAIVRYRDGQTENNLLPAAYNIRSRVHEYGGGAYCVSNGVIFFSNDADQNIYRIDVSGSITLVLSTENGRFADYIVDSVRQRLIAVCEDHGTDRPEPENSLVAVGLAESPELQVLVSGSDFYACPRMSPDGTRLAWLSWDHPNMPWDGCELWLASIADDGSLIDRRKIAGGPDESIFQPQFSADGRLFFVSDKSGWWNIYCYQDGQLDDVLPMAAEFGLPLWQFGMSTYALLSDKRILCGYCELGCWRLAMIDIDSSTLVNIDTPYTEISSVTAAAGIGAFIAASPEVEKAVVIYRPGDGDFQMLTKPQEINNSAAYLSTPEPQNFPVADNQRAYGFFYPPSNKNTRAPEGTLPPLIVKSHGGPTMAATATYNAKIQFWTSRGFAVLDVNYGGSTGYGKAYRKRLEGNWGITDVADCISGARFLADQGRVDPDRLIIAGSSAGGYTTLCALTFHDTFDAGASYYGISDLQSLVNDTHKFEARYLDRLIGPLPISQDVYDKRSPVNYTDRLSCPVIFFQGLEDKVVPPDQAATMVASLKDKGVAVAYITFENEQHGFRRAENVERALESELYFYSKVFGFTLADNPVQIEISNIDKK